jgi:hypothetical protein
MYARHKTHSLNIPSYIVGIFVFLLSSVGLLFLLNSPASAAGANCYDFNAYPNATAVQQCIATNPGPDGKPAKIYTMSPEDQVKSFLYGQAMRFCFNKGTLIDGPSTGHISSDNAAAGDWFIGEGAGVVLFSEAAYVGAIVMGSQNEYANCHDEDFINEAFAFWGWDKLEALCDMGWHRESDENPANCRNGSGFFRPPSTDGNTRTAAFENALKAKIYGNNQYDLTPHQKYVLYRDTFTRGCAAAPLAAGAVSTGTIFTLDMVGGDGTITPTKFEAKADSGQEKYIYILNDYGEYDLECGQLVDAANNGLDGQDYKGAFATFQKISGASSGGITGSTGATGNTEEDLCDKLGTSSLRWVMCPLFTMMDSATAWIKGAIQEILKVDIETFFGPGMKNAWNTFRNISLSLLVIAALVMVISQAAGFDFLDAYAIKKTLPRLLIAIIGITLSWELMRFVVQFFNDIGDWVYAIITSAFTIDTVNIPWTDDWGSTAAAAGGVAVAGVAVGAVGAGLFLLAIAPGGIGVILATLALFLLSLIIALMVLGIRLAIIGVCIIMAPLAIAAYVLPGTKKVWDFWQNTFITALLMFPIVMAFIATGSALSSVLGATNTGIFGFLSIIVYFAPYLLLPFAFKLSGGLMKTIFSIADDKNKGVFDRLRKGRSRSMGKVSQHHGENMMEYRSKKLDSLQSTASKTGNRARFAYVGGWAVGGGKYGNVEARMSAIRAQKNKEASEQIATGLDNEIRALSVEKAAADRGGMEAAARADGSTYSLNGLRRTDKNGVQQYKTLGGAWVKSAEVDAAHRRWKGDTAMQQKSLSYEMTKASHKEDVESIGQRYASLAQNDWGMNDFQAGGAWIGASYENQNKHRQLKSMDWKSGSFHDTNAAGGKDYSTVGAQGRMKKFTEEVHENLGSYPLAQMNAQTVRELQTVWTHTKDANVKAKLQSIAETFTHDMASGMPGTQIPGTAGGAPQAVLPGQPGANGTGRMVNTPGSAEMAEAVREFAGMTGIKYQAPTQPAAPSPVPPINTKPHS